VQWDSVRPGNCAIIRRSLTNTFRNADWLGQCGVPAARMRSVAVNACRGASDPTTINNSPNRLPRGEFVLTDESITTLTDSNCDHARFGAGLLR
jgi:hypothetical protein